MKKAALQLSDYLSSIGLLLTVAGLVASILSYRQSERAASSAADAAAKADAAAADSRLAATRADWAIENALKEAKARTISSHLMLLLQLVGEVETLVGHSLFPTANVRSRDLSKQLTYVIARFNSTFDASTLTVLVEAKAQMDGIARKLQGSQGPGKAEHLRLLAIVQRVNASLTTEYAKTEKEEDGRPK